jgi:hypothetical protein
MSGMSMIAKPTTAARLTGQVRANAIAVGTRAMAENVRVAIGMG